MSTNTIKIMVALALRNSDIKISHEGKTFVIPDDASALTGSKGPLTARKRDIFDACKLTRINILMSQSEMQSSYLRLLIIT